MVVLVTELILCWPKSFHVRKETETNRFLPDHGITAVLPRCLYLWKIVWKDALGTSKLPSDGSQETSLTLQGSCSLPDVFVPLQV